MTDNAQILVTCTDAACALKIRVPLLDLAKLIELYPDDEILGFDVAQAIEAAVRCPACTRAGRAGTLVYMSDHLRESPPDLNVAVPVVFDFVASLWKRAVEKRSVIGKVAEYRPEKLGVVTGVRLSVRPYGGHVLRPGNSDDPPQYGERPASDFAATTNPRYIRELKHDLLYLAYYGTRERLVAKDLGGVSAFEATTVGGMLALKFDLWFFYGVPTTTDLAAATVSDTELRGVTLDTFNKPIYFDPKLPDNPIKPLAERLFYPLGARLQDLSAARPHYQTGLAVYQQAAAPDLPAKKAKTLRAKALKALRQGMKKLPAEAPPVDLASGLALKAERVTRGVEEVLAHPQFVHCRRSPWEFFAADLRRVADLDVAREVALLEELTALLAQAEEKDVKQLEAAVSRYRLHADVVVDAKPAQLDDLRRVLGGLPETFGSYRAEMHRYAAVDHATAFYIKSILAGIKIGSNSGKIVAQPGRKLVYRTAEGGIQGEPEDLKGYADMVVEACEQGGVFFVPPLILLERQKNESGFRATDKVGNLALAKEEQAVRVPMVGIDWKNWGRKGATVTNFAFSELFTNSVGMPQTHPGYHGPIVLSRGVGGGQVTAPTLVKGVSPAGRQEVENYEWVAGIPVPEGGKMPTPDNWMGAKGSIARSRDILMAKFRDKENRKRDCTFGDVPGGKKFDCVACLARFKLDEQPDLVWNAGGGSASYHCKVEAPRWEALFGEKLLTDDEKGRTEYPCTWLRAVQKYAGAGPKSYQRILKAAREIVAIGKHKGDELEVDEDGVQLDDKAQKKAAKDARKVMQAAFVRVRKRL